MVRWLQRIVCLFLYRTGASVAVNVDCKSDLEFRHRNQYLYGCNVEGRLIHAGKVIPIPKGKFKGRLKLDELQDV